MFGYFWGPCPECGRMYGGHEVRNINATVFIADGIFVVCPKCVPLVLARNLAEVKAPTRSVE